MQNPQTQPVEPARSDDEFSLIELAAVLAENKRLLISVPLICAGLAFGGSYLLQPTFTAAAQILSPQQQSGAAALLGNLGGLGSLAGGALGAGLKNPADQWIGLLKSRTVADAMIERFKLKERYEEDYDFRTRQKLENNTRFIAGKDGMIDIEVDDHDPQMAADMANAYIEELKKLSDTLAVGEAAQRRLFFEQQLKSAKENLTKAELALRESGLNSSIIKTSPDAAVAALADLKAQVTTTEVKLQVMQGTLTRNSPELQAMQRQLNSLRAQLTQAEQSDPSATKGSGAQYVTHYRDFKYYETLFEMMARQYELARADEAKEGATIQIVDQAAAPEWKSKPKRVIIAIGSFFIGMFATLAYVLSRNAINNIKADPVAAPKWERLRRNFSRKQRPT